MGKIRRGNYVFVSWIGDHGHHVHIYRDNKLVAKWDLTHQKLIMGQMNARLRKIIQELVSEGVL